MRQPSHIESGNLHSTRAPIGRSEEASTTLHPGTSAWVNELSGDFLIAGGYLTVKSPFIKRPDESKRKDQCSQSELGNALGCFWLHLCLGAVPPHAPHDLMALAQTQSLGWRFSCLLSMF